LIALIVLPQQNKHSCGKSRFVSETVQYHVSPVNAQHSYWFKIINIMLK